MPCHTIDTTAKSSTYISEVYLLPGMYQQVTALILNQLGVT